MLSEQTRRAVSYARTASTRKTDQGAADRQQRACRQAAGELHATLEHEFADHGASGLTLDRPALRRLLAYIEANHVDYVICADGSG
jgi:DNA invertase Pin-like site-specific DNA recombinase